MVERDFGDETMRLFTTTKSSVNSSLGLINRHSNNNASPTSPQAPVSVYGHTGYTGTSFD